jgi:hypothetical protein
MKYAIQMGSGAMICIPGFTKTGSGIQEFTGGDSQPTFIFSTYRK